MQITSTRIPDSGMLVGDEVQFALTESSSSAFEILTPTSVVVMPDMGTVTPTPVVDPTGSLKSHNIFVDVNEATAGSYLVKVMYNVGVQKIVRNNQFFVTWTAVYSLIADLMNSSTLTQQKVDNALYQIALVTPGISDLPGDAIVYSYATLTGKDQSTVDLALAHLAAAYMNGFTLTEIPTGAIIASVKGTDETRWSSGTKTANPQSIEDQWIASAMELLASTTLYGPNYAMKETSVISPVTNAHVTTPDLRRMTLGGSPFQWYGRCRGRRW